MKVYMVKNITEADFGCEETGRDEPMALLYLESITDPSETRYAEVTESTLCKQGIEEGKKVVFTENGEIRKYVRVVAAIILDKEKESGSNIVFATQRGYGEYKGWWEFPGGKIETGETPEQALVREIREELTAEIKVGELIKTIEYDYPGFHLSMDCFWAEIVSGSLVLKEAEAACWLKKEELLNVDWLPADLELIGAIRQGM